MTGRRGLGFWGALRAAVLALLLTACAGTSADITSGTQANPASTTPTAGATAMLGASAIMPATRTTTVTATLGTGTATAASGTSTRSPSATAGGTTAGATPTPAGTSASPDVAITSSSNAGGGGGKNEVRVVNYGDERMKIRGNIDFNRIPGPNVEPVNLAYATSSCTDCQTIAVALQINLISRTATRIAPQNAAIAINQQCTRCVTVARALQYNYQVDDPQQTPQEVSDLLREMDRTLNEISQDKGISLSEAESRIDAVIAQFRQLATSLNDQRSEDTKSGDPATPTGVPGTRTPAGTQTVVPTGTAASSPSATVVTSPTALPATMTPTTTVTPASAATVTPTVVPTPSATPGPTRTPTAAASTP
jgi:hypothetical protein